MGIPASVVDAAGAATSATNNADDTASSSVLVTNPVKTREAIGKALQLQYEYWHSRAKYRLLLDTNTDELRKTLQVLRKGAKRERVLFHYNGHGVPMPTQNGELWVFNRAFTQYIPVHVADIEAWMGRPAVVVLDCAAAGRIVEAWLASQPSSPQASPKNSADVLIFAACGAEETLPTVADLPADLLTACLTTPVEMALRWHVYRRANFSCTARHKIPPDIEHARAIVHGKPSDRRTPLGHLTWIFTAITDALAWLTLPLDTFKSLFRQDLLVASLSRNFLLASRIGHACCIAPSSHPVNLAANRNIHQHDLWMTWEHCLDTVLAGLPCTFFADQLESFRLWIEHEWLVSPNIGFVRPISSGIDDAANRLEAISLKGKSEAQSSERNDLCPHLPIILQVLLSQEHRRDALHLMLAFCDLGPLAVLSALHVGAHPYIAKLLQSTAADIRPALMAIWLRVQIVDGDTATWDESQREVLREDAYRYFSNAVVETGRSFAAANAANGNVDQASPNRNQKDKPAQDKEDDWIDETVTGLACLTAFCKHGHATNGQRAVQDKNGMPEYLSELALKDARKNVRLWSLLLIGVSMRGATSPCKYLLPHVYELARRCLKEDPCPEVRAGAAFLFGAFADGTDEVEVVAQVHAEIRQSFDCECSPFVRQEMVIAMNTCSATLESLEYTSNDTVTKKTPESDVFPDVDILCHDSSRSSTLYEFALVDLLARQASEYRKWQARRLSRIPSIPKDISPPESLMLPKFPAPNFIPDTYDGIGSEGLQRSLMRDMMQYAPIELALLAEEVEVDEHFVQDARMGKVQQIVILAHNAYLVRTATGVLQTWRCVSVEDTKKMVITSAWKPKNSYKDVCWRDNRLYLVRDNDEGVDVWDAAQERVIAHFQASFFAAMEDETCRFDNAQLHYKNHSFGTFINRKLQRLLASRDFFVLIYSDGTCNVLTSSLTPHKFLGTGGIVLADAHPRFNWLAAIVKATNSKAGAVFMVWDLEKDEMLGQMDLREDTTVKTIYWHPEDPKCYLALGCKAENRVSGKESFGAHAKDRTACYGMYGRNVIFA